jgi:hypothetical protein
MDIFELEDKLQFLNAPKLIPILELIIGAINDYPLYNLYDTDDYFKEVKRRLKIETITLQSLERYLKLNRDSGFENAIWIYESLSGLAEAFRLMAINEISFNDVLDNIDRLSK